MAQKQTLRYGLGVVGLAAIGAAAYYLTRKDNSKDLVHTLEHVTDDLKEKGGGLAKSLKDKATPIMRTIGELVENNAEIVSAIANLNADQVRKTGQDIRQAATTLEKNLDALSNL